MGKRSKAKGDGGGGSGQTDGSVSALLVRCHVVPRMHWAGVCRSKLFIIKFFLRLFFLSDGNAVNFAVRWRGSGGNGT